ncbi:MAG: NADH:ubiquinone oxidoreductase subunit NDUFA12 [Pseudomonadota bacterium]
MASLIKRLVTWWDGQSLGTQIFTSRHGTRVGEDDEGNVYYRNPDDTRRWVIYNGDNDATRVGPEWYGWLHHTFEKPPTEEPVQRKAWEKPHQPNLTGSDGAFLRPGSLRRADVKPQSDYEAWSPE